MNIIQRLKKIRITIKGVIERIRMSSDDFKEMCLKAKKYNDILSSVYISQSINGYIDCKDKHGNVIYRYPKEKECSVSVDTDKILHILGIDIAK